MKMVEYAEKIMKMAKKYPDALVVHARDEEGNGYEVVYYDPTAGQFADGEFGQGDKPINAVCIN